MEAFECGKEACSAGHAASGALNSVLGHRAVLPLMCGLFGCMPCMSVTQRRQPQQRNLWLARAVRSGHFINR